eukprot:CAMPEP_0185829456 /NCGR_PEP_ID=MMETSP1353-20130828/259_1 /TAXON_ID=1077150 /ORGANISM="Erythrolobus australicus, Strain CCMP3124" /LENGTH=475 /DNA_ID=CAMNT_0028527255 /DNA_START=117 /DNA_END=1544 /DNA_ORIENTATION=-
MSTAMLKAFWTLTARKALAARHAETLGMLKCSSASSAKAETESVVNLQREDKLTSKTLNFGGRREMLDARRLDRAVEMLAPLLGKRKEELLPVPPRVHLSTGIIARVLARSTASADVAEALYAYADAMCTRHFQDRVWFRGIVEFSNVCRKNCGYCGIRRLRRGVVRYTMSQDDVLECAQFCMARGYGTIMLQSGELQSEQRIAWIVDTIRKIREQTTLMDVEHGRGLCVALSVGELPREAYERFFEAGARRYLLRVETSSPTLYAKLHPPDHLWERRVECLRALKDIGFQLGSGFLIKVPGQSLRTLARDIAFMREIGADMVGVGPYIWQSDTPVGATWEEAHRGVSQRELEQERRETVELTTLVIALLRITLGNVNIPATTALQALDSVGREKALSRGANVVMPIVTPSHFRKQYQLYKGKPCLEDTAPQCANCLDRRVTWAGKSVALFDWGDPPSYAPRFPPPPLPHNATLT